MFRRRSSTRPRTRSVGCCWCPSVTTSRCSLSKLSGTTTVEGMSSTIDPGFRAVSVQITDASGVAGLVQPNAHVDVLFTRPGSMAEATTSTILENVKVLSTGQAAAHRRRRSIRARRGHRW